MKDVVSLLAPQRDALAEINGNAAADGILEGIAGAIKSLETLKMLHNGREQA